MMEVIFCVTTRQQRYRGSVAVWLVGFSFGRGSIPVAFLYRGTPSGRVRRQPGASEVAAVNGISWLMALGPFCYRSRASLDGLMLY